MSTVADFLLEFIEFNKDVDYAQVFLGVVIYFMLFWLAVSVWVIKDAVTRGIKRRYAVLIGMATFLLSIPFLLLYLLARPHFTEEFDEWHEGGVNIPIVNFTGEKGIEMSFELRVHPKNLSKIQNSDMKIGIEFDSKSEKFEIASDTNTDAKKKMKDNKKSNSNKNVEEDNKQKISSDSATKSDIRTTLKDLMAKLKSVFIKKETIVANDEQKNDKDKSSKTSIKVDSVDEILSNEEKKDDDKKTVDNKN